MKRIVVLMAIVSTLSSNAQNVQELEEARIEMASASPIIVTGTNSVVVEISETYSGEFERNPLKFMKENFDIKSIMAQMGQKDKYFVTFKNRRGNLRANFDKNGNLQYYSLKFKNARVPYELMHQLYKEHRGWALVKTTHIARGNGEAKDVGYYKVVMKNGGEKKNFKYNAFQSPSEVANFVSK